MENIFLSKTRLDIILVVNVINSRKNFINVTIVADVKFNYWRRRKHRMQTHCQTSYFRRNEDAALQ